MVTIALAITTAPRPRPTLVASHDSLEMCGYRGAPPLICRDGDPPQGIVRTWATALRRLLAEREAELLGICQDDVTYPPGGWSGIVAELETLLATYPTLGYASLHTSGRVRLALEEAAGGPCTGWLETGQLPIRWSGAQCYMLPRLAARRLLDDPAFQRSCETEYQSIDVLVTAALNRLGLQTLTRLPSLVGHELGKGNRTRRLRPGAAA